jgi:hypothetical protein
MIPERDAAEAARLLGERLESMGYSYAIGGALALAVAGVPRGTIDVDLNVFVTEDDVEPLARLLGEMGVTLDVPSAVARARRDGMFVGTWDGMRIDVFVPSIPFSEEAERTKVRVTSAEGWTGWFLSAEALSVFKLLFFRGKDIVDLERLIAVRDDDLDHAYVRGWLVTMMGEDDERVARWDDIVARFGPSAAAPA